MTKWITILLCLVGLAIGAFAVATSGEKPPNPPPLAAPSVNPYANGIAASGSIEAESRNVSISPPVGGLVMAMLVHVNESVKVGQDLFRLDSRDLQAQLLREEAALRVARAQLGRLKAQPREEDLPPLRAEVARAKARLADMQFWYDTLSKATSDNAVNPTELTRTRFALEAAQADLATAETNLARAQAGAWSEDIAISEAQVGQAQANVDAVKALIERMTVRSPIDGVVLKRNIEPGAFARAESTDPGSAALVIGDLSTLHVRARVDEEDTPRLREGAASVLRVRGASEQAIPLKMVRIEPLAEPKVTLTGSVTERVDTRVVEVVFEVTGKTPFRLFPGQVVDVYIEAKE
ncbi:MAG: HlyD family secretion protein [Phycisphaerales bacterium]